MDRRQLSPWGTQRRLRTPMNRSRAPAAIERTAGIPAEEITRALAGPRSISPDLAEQVAAAYDRLWDQQPPHATRRDRELADAVQAHAQAGSHG